MPNRPLRRGGRGGFEGGVRGACAYTKPHNSSHFVPILAKDTPEFFDKFVAGELAN